MSNRPNIVFIMADDLGYADVGCYGRPELATPNIDRIAARGVRLTQGYANSAVCSATRLALITGRYQYRLPLGLEEPLAGKLDVGLPPEHPTLPSLLRQAGYRTALVGKWHLGVPPKFGPQKSGYDRFYGIVSGAADYYSHQNTRGGHDLWDGDEPVRRSGYMTDLLGDRAVATLNDYAARGQPFLLSLHFNAPHWPWEAPGDRAESERLRGSNLRHYDGGTQQTYFRMIQAMDLQIGRVLQALDANGIADNTIVIFTSDNGGERFSDTWPFTGIKTELLEGGLRVPTLICWPARIPAGQVSSQVAITMDWFPTLLEAAGSAADAAYPPDGITLLPVLSGQHQAVSRKLFWRYKTNAQRAVRDGDFKYLKIRDNTYLFDVVKDPRERANLQDRRRDLTDRLVADWHAWNATMLPEIPDSAGETYTAAQLADHIGMV
ncbi:MAG TPA: sulfatase-like hydrolase/transferase [Acetobacteraceae bacterium]|nr:sulfatase-like hydrolase/transferase [Acetobacteraceae bacterium]